MPFPLPPAQPFSEGLRWFLVAVPEDTEFVRAALGAYTELAHAWQWGAEGRETGSDEAARLFQVALDETMRAWEMGLLDDIVDSIDEVEELLAALGTVGGYICCDDVSATGDIVTTDVVPNEGPVPDYGDTTPADWDEWHEFLCNAAHMYVDARIVQAVELSNLLKAGTVIIGAVASILSLGAAVGLILTIKYAAATAVTAGLAGAGSLDLDNAASELEAARDDIVCAVMNGTSLAVAIEDAVSSLSWNLLFRWIDYDSHRAQLYNGDGIPAISRTDCNCDPPSETQIIVCIGTLVETDTYSSASPAGCHRVDLWWSRDVVVTVGTDTGSGTCGGVNQYRGFTGFASCSGGGSTVYASSSPPSGVTMNRLAIVHNGSFQVTVTWVDV